jgi:hypothetical protein
LKIPQPDFKIICFEYSCFSELKSNSALAAQRAANVQTYLTAELKKLKFKKTIGVSVVAKISGALAAIKVVGGK